MKKSDTLLINFYAGPGTGKSSSMAGVFSQLKWMGVNCEMAPEFAKEKVWEGSLNILDNQIYVFGKQLHTIHRLLGKVEVIITDSPLLLSIIYGKNECQEFKDLVLRIHSQLNTWNIFLLRQKAFNPSGRLQDENQAKEIDNRILKLLDDNKVPYDRYPTGKKFCEDIAKMAVERIGKDKLKYK